MGVDRRPVAYRSADNCIAVESICHQPRMQSAGEEKSLTGARTVSSQAFVGHHRLLRTCGLNNVKISILFRHGRSRHVKAPNLLQIPAIVLAMWMLFARAVSCGKNLRDGEWAASTHCLMWNYNAVEPLAIALEVAS